MAWLCIDAGTSVIKSVVFSAEGRELAVARASVAVLRPQEGFAEQEMEAVWQAVLDTGRRAASDAGVNIHAIATTAQGDGVWLVDAEGLPVQNAVLWNDGRAASIVDEWLATPSVGCVIRHRRTHARQQPRQRRAALPVGAPLRNVDESG